MLVRRPSPTSAAADSWSPPARPGGPSTACDISNKSTGRLGTAIATKALAAGAEVTFVYGTESLAPDPHPALALVEVETVSDLVTALERELTRKPHDAIIHLMAVLDYEPAEYLAEKVPSGREEWVVRLKPTPKVIARLKGWAPRALLVGFKLEDRLSDAELVAEAQALAKTAPPSSWPITWPRLSRAVTAPSSWLPAARCSLKLSGRTSSPTNC